MELTNDQNFTWPTQPGRFDVQFVGAHFFEQNDKFPPMLRLVVQPTEGPDKGSMWRIDSYLRTKPQIKRAAMLAKTFGLSKFVRTANDLRGPEAIGVGRISNAVARVKFDSYSQKIVVDGLEGYENDPQ